VEISGKSCGPEEVPWDCFFGKGLVFNGILSAVLMEVMELLVLNQILSTLLFSLILRHSSVRREKSNQKNQENPIPRTRLHA
jgi:hypothetical protein